MTGSDLDRRLLFVLVLGLTLTLQAAAQPPTIPAPLQPWVGWVLDQHPDLQCPLVDGQRLCAWPGRLTLELEDDGGRFRLEVVADRALSLPLPGDPAHWPQEVTQDNAPALLRREGEQPTVQLSAGQHQLTGRFRWSRLPESLAVPAQIALVDLRLRGTQVLFPRREINGLLWLAASRSEEGEFLEVEVQRRIDDGVPLQLTTRVLLRVGGRAREVDLGAPLPPGFELAALAGDLPLRFTPDRHLLTQVRAGEWELRVTARSADQVHALACTAQPSPWPAEELWVFHAAPTVRSVRLAGAPNIDPQRTSLPPAWKSLAAFQLTPGATLTFTELRRGEAQPPPDEITVQREFWLAQDGDRFTVRDHLQGALRLGGRLEAAAPGELGRAQLGTTADAVTTGSDQVITLGPASGRPGLEVRQGALDLQADLTYPRGALPAVGWDRDAQQLGAELHLPPGWTLLAAFGVDGVHGAWVFSWTLLDLFLLLIASLAVSQLFGRGWGAAAFVLLGLAWQEPWASELRSGLLVFLPLEALSRVLAQGRAARFVHGLRGLARVTLAVLLLVFVTSQWRTGLFPQLEATTSEGVLDAMSPLSLRAKTPVTRIGGDISQMIPATPTVEAYGAVASYSDRAGRARQIDPNAVVQTGPGVPNWSSRTATLSWRGPVVADHRLRLLLLSPEIELWLSLVRIAGLVILFWRLLLGTLQNVLPTATVLLALALPGIPAHAQEQSGTETGAENGTEAGTPSTPAPNLLQELERRLTAPPPCAPHCLEVARMAIAAGADLRIAAEVHAAAPTAWALPGPVSAWLPAQVSVDGVAATALRLGDDGFLRLRLARGIHQIALTGPARDSLTLQLPLPPRTLSWQGQGWAIDGLRPDEAPPKTVRLDRQLPAAVGSEAVAEVPPWLELRRELDLGIPWLVHTELRRLGPPGTAVVVRVPLLPGESLTTGGIALVAGEAVVSLEPGESTRSWRSTLAETATLTLTAPTGRPWLERWELDCSAIWHCQAEGLAPTQHLQDGRWRPVWQPWPGEQVRLHLVRPAGAPGQTTTFDQLAYTLSLGRRLLEADLTAQLRTSRGGEQILTLPADAQLSSFQIDGSEQPVQFENHQLTFALEPGAHQIRATWRQPRGTHLIERAPAVQVGNEAVNVTTTIALPQDRWLLWAGGPGWGPVILFWQYLLAVGLVGLALGRFAPTPLGTRDWLLLGAGLTQVPLPVALIVGLYPISLGLRHRVPPRRFWSYDLQQLVFFGWGLAAACGLYFAIHAGLLLRPDMQVAGPGSHSTTLAWYVERIAGALPQPWVLSLPLWVWRLLMLLWALWLASRLLRWLPWCWGRLAQGPLLASRQGFAAWQARATATSPPDPLASS